jgi:hypothetical protein
MLFTGKQAILRIYDPAHPNVIQETIQIYHLKTRTEMHDLLQRKGFVKKSVNQIQQLQLAREEQHAISAKRGYVESHRGVVRIKTPPGWQPPAKQHGQRLVTPPQQQPGHLRGTKIHSHGTTPSDAAAAAANTAVAAPVISSPRQGNGSTDQKPPPPQQQQQQEQLEIRSHQEPSVGGGTGMEMPETTKVTQQDNLSLVLHQGGNGRMSPFPGSSSSTTTNNSNGNSKNDILMYVPMQLALAMIGMAGLVWGMIQRRRQRQRGQGPEQQQQLGRRTAIIFGGCPTTRLGPFFCFKSPKEERTSQ